MGDLNLNVSYDSNTLNNAPAAFFNAVNYVSNLFDSLFNKHVLVNVEIGYGTFPLDNSMVPALRESEQNHVTSVGYSQVVQHLVNQGAPGSGTLSASSPVSGVLLMGSAQEKALGLLGASSSLDGWVGVASDATSCNRPADRGASVRRPYPAPASTTSWVCWSTKSPRSWVDDSGQLAGTRVWLDEKRH